MENKYDIEAWVATRSFDELSEAEKTFVIEELGSQVAYSEMRRIVLSIQSEDEEIMPGFVRQNIMNAFDSHYRSSDEKIIPMVKSKTQGYKKILVYGLIAASILVAVFLILPEKNSNSNKQIAENKVKKEINTDSAANHKSVEKDIEKSAPEAAFKKQENISPELKVPGFKDSKNLGKDQTESESPEMSNENVQSFSVKSNQSDGAINNNTADTDALPDSELQKLDEIAAPPQPALEMNLDKEPEIFSGNLHARSAESQLKSKLATEITFKIEGFTQNHYTSY
ncbi:hypothetical protein G3O08_13040 [Cryomorpha ignava]|uniref:Uncharacterized protein n=1 Tax=Cryomorpha ignava TaxID=101383 RepID=A0A7K3WRY1_9FLAO|nr:hypothetical protein [Cryomorpha ignava]NEN24430.1 hypothetical protein [Cryomorpha ignava]